MFDFDIGKLMVVAIVALAVIPPKDLPRVMRTVGQFVGRMRRMAAEFQGQFMDAMREADLDGVRKELEELKNQTRIQETFDPVGMVRDDVTKAAEQSSIGTSTVSLEEPKPSGLEAPGACRGGRARRSGTGGGGDRPLSRPARRGSPAGRRAGTRA